MEKSALKVPFKFLGKRFNIHIGSTLNNFFGDLKKNIHTKGGGGKSSGMHRQKTRSLAQSNAFERATCWFCFQMGS